MFFCKFFHILTSRVAQTMSLPTMQETPVQPLGWEDPLEKEMATHSSILAWRIPMEGGAWWAIWSMVYFATKPPVLFCVNSHRWVPPHLLRSGIEGHRCLGLTFSQCTRARESGSFSSDSPEELPFPDTAKLLHKAEGTPEEGFSWRLSPEKHRKGCFSNHL